MRVPSLRVAVVALAAVAVFAGGTLATRGGPIGGDGAGTDAGGPTGSAITAAEPTTSLASLGSMSERLARLPVVATGELAGVLDFADADGCEQQTIDAATLVVRRPFDGVCAAAGGRFGVQLDDVGRDGSKVGVVDRDGHQVETVPIPTGWSWWGLARDGIVFCDGLSGRGRIHRFGGAAAALPSCPIGQGQDGLLFAGPARRSIVDARGRRVAALTAPLDEFPPVIRGIGDALLVVGEDLYGDGRLLRSFHEDRVRLLSASRDGNVALVGVGPQLVIYHEATAHPIDPSIATRGGAVSPDGTRVLVQHEQAGLILLDAVTLRPLARLDYPFRAELDDWRSAPGP